MCSPARLPGLVCQCKLQAAKLASHILSSEHWWPGLQSSALDGTTETHEQEQLDAHHQEGCEPTTASAAPQNGVIHQACWVDPAIIQASMDCTLSMQWEVPTMQMWAPQRPPCSSRISWAWDQLVLKGL